MHTASRHRTRFWTAAAALVMAGLGAMATMSLVACNTVEGAGKDIKAAGEGIQDAAD